VGKLRGVGGEIAGFLRHMVAAMGWRRVAGRLPLTGVAVAGAVIGHTLAYVLAVPHPGARLVLLATTGHTYWSTAIAVAVVCGLASVASSLIRQFRAGLLAARRPPERSLGRLAGRLAMLQVGIYLVQETLERVAVGASPGSLLQGRLLAVGLVAQLVVALALAVVLRAAGLVAECAGRALRRRHRQVALAAPLTFGPIFVWASRLLAGGLGSRAPPGCGVSARTG
jgi:hypothetical protein